MNDALKKLDLTKLEGKDLSLENIAKLTGLTVEELCGDIPNRRFREVVDLTLKDKLRGQSSVAVNFEKLYTSEFSDDTSKRQRDAEDKFPFAPEEEESWVINEVILSQEQEGFLHAKMSDMGIEDKTARATAIQKVRN